MFKKKNENGRSMVEMLGVLAIIGVLSIGGIAGYTLSMRRHRANQVVDLVNKYGTVVYGACQKAMVDGDITSITSCSSNHTYPDFKDAGLGTIGDASILGLWDYISESSDKVRMHITVRFRDLQVCKAAKSISGSEYDCHLEDNSLPLTVTLN